MRVDAAFAAVLLTVCTTCVCSDPLQDASEKLSNIQFKSSSVEHNLNLSAVQIDSWEQAKPVIINLWKELLVKCRTTQPHATFIRQNGLHINFGSLSGKLGTYDRATHSAKFDNHVLSTLWEVLVKQGLAKGRAAQILAIATFPGFAHVLRDEMLTRDLEQNGFVDTGGWLEDEVIHHKEEATVISESRRFMPASPKVDLWIVDSSLMFDDILAAARQGVPEIVRFVRQHYSGLPSLFYPNRPRWDKHDSIQKNLSETVCDTELNCHIHDWQQELATLVRKLNDCRKNNGYYFDLVKDPEDPVHYSGPPRPSLGGFYEERFKCDPNWESSIPKQISRSKKVLAFLHDPTELNRLRQFYRKVLSAFSIKVEDLQ